VTDRQAIQGLTNATRREKSRRASHFAGPSFPTSKQIGMIGGMIGTQHRGHIEAFVRFANCYEPGDLTRVHYIHAIDLLVNGVNLYGTAEQLYHLSTDPDAILIGDVGEFQRKQIARRKGQAKAKKAGAGNAAKLAPTMRELSLDRGERLRSLAREVDQARAARHRKPT